MKVKDFGGGGQGVLVRVERDFGPKPKTEYRIQIGPKTQEDGDKWDYKLGIKQPSDPHIDKKDIEKWTKRKPIIFLEEKESMTDQVERKEASSNADLKYVPSENLEVPNQSEEISINSKNQEDPAKNMDVNDGTMFVENKMFASENNIKIIKSARGDTNSARPVVSKQFDYQSIVELTKKMEVDHWLIVDKQYKTLVKSKYTTYSSLSDCMVGIVEEVYGPQGGQELLDSIDSNRRNAVMKLGKILLNLYHEAYTTKNVVDKILPTNSVEEKKTVPSNKINKVQNKTVADSRNPLNVYNRKPRLSPRCEACKVKSQCAEGACVINKFGNTNKSTPNVKKTPKSQSTPKVVNNKTESTKTSVDAPPKKVQTKKPLAKRSKPVSTVAVLDDDEKSFGGIIQKDITKDNKEDTVNLKEICKEEGGNIVKDSLMACNEESKIDMKEKLKTGKKLGEEESKCDSEEMGDVNVAKKNDEEIVKKEELSSGDAGVVVVDEVKGRSLQTLECLENSLMALFDEQQVSSAEAIFRQMNGLEHYGRETFQTTLDLLWLTDRIDERQIQEEETKHLSKLDLQRPSTSGSLETEDKRCLPEICINNIKFINMAISVLFGVVAAYLTRPGPELEHLANLKSYIQVFLRGVLRLVNGS